MSIFEKIQKAIKNGNYALRPHTVTHMLSEGFEEGNIVEAIINGKILEHYTEEYRCLITGKFQISKHSKESLHIVVDYWSETEEIEWVDIVTTYIPRKPFWGTPNRRGKIQ